MGRSQFLLSLTLFAFALRIWRLDAPSLRGDEAFDVLFALQAVDEIIYQLRNNQIYPPLYHVFDHYWLLIAGASQLAARFSAFFAGVWLVPISYRLARQLADERIARLTALLVAIHPFLIWHAQDGRMYAPLATFAALATFFALKIHPTAQSTGAGRSTSDVRSSDPPSKIQNLKSEIQNQQSKIQNPKSNDVFYFLFATLAILTHYFAYFVIFALNIVALYTGWRRRWSLRFYAQWFAVNALVGVIALIWIALAWARFSVHSAEWIAPTSSLEVFTRSLHAYSLGMTLEWERAAPFLAVFAGLAILGAWRLGSGGWGTGERGWGRGNREQGAEDRGQGMRSGAQNLEREHGTGTGHASRNTQHGGMVAFLLTALPILTIYLGSLWRPMYDEKFLIFIVPTYMALIAAGLVALGRFQTIGVVLVAGGMLLSWWNYHFDPRFAKSPLWRELAQQVLSQTNANDLLIYNFPDPALLYQIGNRLPTMLLPANDAYAATGATTQAMAATEATLAELSAQHERIWFVPQPSPLWDKERSVAHWLARFSEREAEAMFGSLTLERYLTPRGYQKLWTPLNADFADGIRLVAYRAVPIKQPQTAVRLVLYWQASVRPSKDYTIFTHLLDSTGVLRAQQDNPPVNGSYPTTAWKLNTLIVDRYDIIIAPDAPAGRYRFEVGLYDASGTRLRVGNDDKLIFGEYEK